MESLSCTMESQVKHAPSTSTSCCSDFPRPLPLPDRRCHDYQWPVRCLTVGMCRWQSQAWSLSDKLSEKPRSTASDLLQAADSCAALLCHCLFSYLPSSQGLALPASNPYFNAEFRPRDQVAENGRTSSRSNPMSDAIPHLGAAIRPQIKERLLNGCAVPDQIFSSNTPHIMLRTWIRPS